MDLLHKQMRKPLESLSPYYRVLEQISFENPRDRILDLSLLEQPTSQEGSLAYVAVNVENKFLAVIKYKIGVSKVKD